MKKLILFFTLCRTLINLSRSSTLHFKETTTQLDSTREMLLFLLVEPKKVDKEEWLEKLANLLEKHNVRQYTCINKLGYSAIERNIVDLFLNH